jgi:hypothetical protein
VETKLAAARFFLTFASSFIFAKRVSLPNQMSFDEKTPPHTAFDGFRFAWLQPPFVSDADNAACCHCDTG